MAILRALMTFLLLWLGLAVFVLLFWAFLRKFGIGLITIPSSWRPSSPVQSGASSRPPVSWCQEKVPPVRVLAEQVRRARRRPRLVPWMMVERRRKRSGL